MARKAAHKASAASPLDGCSVAVAGRFPGGETQSTLKARLTSLGATFASSISADTTHLVATEKEFGSKSAKVQAATAHDVLVVTLEWLDECEATGEFKTGCISPTRPVIVDISRGFSN
jgi:poly [ADP-ribose] polymerase